MMDELPLYEAPQDCNECKAQNGPFKKANCSFEAALRLVDTKLDLKARGVTLDTTTAMKALQNDAQQCRAGIEAKVNEENHDIRLTNRVAKMLAIQQVQAAPTKPAPAPIEEPAKEVHEPTAPASNGLVQATQQVARGGDPGLYVREADRELEAQVIEDNEEDVHYLSFTPRLAVAKLEAYIDETVLPVFEREPFEGAVAVIPKFHAQNRDYCKVGVYYRGDIASTEASQLIKQWRQEST